METKIILIGNAPTILQHKMKEQIDAFPLVARFNDFVIQGFEEYVGTKTNIWIRSSMDVKHKPLDFERVYFVYPPVLESTFGHRPERYLDKRGNKVFDKNVITVPTAFYTSINQKYIAPPNWASTGLLSIFYFLDKGYDVTIHGFDSFASPNIHYYNDTAKMLMHDANKEKTIINDLIQNNAIKSLVNA